MKLPLHDLTCACGYEEECKSFGIPHTIFKGLLFLSGNTENAEFATALVKRKLARKEIPVEKFTAFVDKIKGTCPYYRQE
jgi:hypothetical protein